MRGATVVDGAIPLNEIMFQSTRPCGARQSEVGAVTENELVSIHAPVRGATIYSVPSFVIPNGFNPRARAGRDV